MITYKGVLSDLVEEKINQVRPYTTIPVKELKPKAAEELRPQALQKCLDILVKSGFVQITAPQPNYHADMARQGSDYYFLFYDGHSNDTNDRAYLSQEPVLNGNGAYLELARYGNQSINSDRFGNLEFRLSGQDGKKPFSLWVDGDQTTMAKKVLSVISEHTGITFTGVKYDIKKLGEDGSRSIVNAKGTYRFREEKDSRGDEK